MKSANIFMRTSYKSIFKYSIVTLAIGIGFAGILMPKIVKQAVRMVNGTIVFFFFSNRSQNDQFIHYFQQLRITPGTMTREMFEKVPFAINFRVFVLNITNPDEVTAGEKPKLQEIGPYYFEWVLLHFSLIFYKNKLTTPLITKIENTRINSILWTIKKKIQ